MSGDSNFTSNPLDSQTTPHRIIAWNADKLTLLQALFAFILPFHAFDCSSNGIRRLHPGELLAGHLAPPHLSERYLLAKSLIVEFSSLATSRKTDMGVLVIAYSEWAKTLDIESAGGFKARFVIARLPINKITITEQHGFNSKRIVNIAIISVQKHRNRTELSHQNKDR